jgi:hypothetical protein
MLDEPALIVSTHGDREFMTGLLPGNDLPYNPAGSRSSCHTMTGHLGSSNGVFYLKEPGRNAPGSGNTPFHAPEDEHTFPDRLKKRSLKAIHRRPVRRL